MDINIKINNMIKLIMDKLLIKMILVFINNYKVDLNGYLDTGSEC